MWLPVKVVDCYFKFQCTPTYKNIHCRGLQLWKHPDRPLCLCQAMAVAVGPRDSGTTWLSALTLSFDSSELSLPHPYRVTSNFLPNCPSLTDNSNNNNVCIYIYSYTLCVSAFAKWRVSKEWQNQTWIILWGRTWRQRIQQINRCLWQKAPA